MKANIVQLHKEEHAKLKVTASVDFSLLDKQNMIPVIAHEIPTAASDLPVAFIKDEKNNSFICSALLGLKPEQNLYIQDGKPKGRFVPSFITHVPFRIAAHPEDDKRFIVLIDTNSTLVSETEGETLFDAKGEDTEFLKHRVNAMANYFKFTEMTKGFVAKLMELDLLIPQSLSYREKGEERKVNGMYIVDEKKLNELSDDIFNDLRKKGFLTPIYAHLVSLNNIAKLVKWAVEEAK